MELTMQGEPLQKWKKLCVFEDGFQYRQQYYSFEDIDSLEFQWISANVRVNFVPAGTDYEAHLKINLTGDRPAIKANHNGSITKWPQASAKWKSQQIYCVYAELAERSYEHRMRKYLTCLSDYGYFIYDGTKFYPNGKVVSGEKEADINTHKLMKLDNNTLFIQVPGKNGFLNLLREILWADPSVYVEINKDKDCFYTLMKRIYGVALADMQTIC
ncbi:MAG: hypothetical protein WBC22_16810 [Sedimentisphaerales bacterium]